MTQRMYFQNAEQMKVRCGEYSMKESLLMMDICISKLKMALAKSELEVVGTTYDPECEFPLCTFLEDWDCDVDENGKMRADPILTTEWILISKVWLHSDEHLEFELRHAHMFSFMDGNFKHRVIDGEDRYFLEPTTWDITHRGESMKVFFEKAFRSIFECDSVEFWNVVGDDMAIPLNRLLGGYGFTRDDMLYRMNKEFDSTPYDDQPFWLAAVAAVYSKLFGYDHNNDLLNPDVLDETGLPQCFDLNQAVEAVAKAIIWPDVDSWEIHKYLMECLKRHRHADVHHFDNDGSNGGNV